jgi:hypothetical protein
MVIVTVVIFVVLIALIIRISTINGILDDLEDRLSDVATIDYVNNLRFDEFKPKRRRRKSRQMPEKEPL